MMMMMMMNIVALPLAAFRCLVATILGVLVYFATELVQRILVHEFDSRFELLELNLTRMEEDVKAIREMIDTFGHRVEHIHTSLHRRHQVDSREDCTFGSADVEPPTIIPSQSFDSLT